MAKASTMTKVLDKQEDDLTSYNRLNRYRYILLGHERAKDFRMTSEIRED